MLFYVYIIRRPTGLAVVRSGPAPRSGASSFAKRSFKQQAKLVVGEALASPPSPGEWPLKPWTLDFCTPPTRKQRFSRKMLKIQGALRPAPPLTGWGFGFENGKKWLGNCLGAALGASKVVFRFPEAPKSALGRVLGSILRETGRQERNKGSRDRFWEPFWLPKCHVLYDLGGVRGVRFFLRLWVRFS